MEPEIRVTTASVEEKQTLLLLVLYTFHTTKQL